MKLGNKGVSILEFVIAMVVLMIVSTTAFTVSMSSIRNSTKTSYIFDAVNVTSDIVNVFRSSDYTTAKLENDLKSFIGGTTNVLENVITLEYNNIFYDITHDETNKKINIVARNEDNSVTFYKQSYSKTYEGGNNHA